jgi:hypothetical protein
VKKILCNEEDVWKIIVVSSNLTILCIDFADKGFVVQQDFPKQQAFVLLENLTYSSSTKID